MTLTMDEEPEYPTYPTATAAEIVEELNSWLQQYEWLAKYRDSESLDHAQEVKYLTNTINSLTGTDVVQTIPDWMDWLDKLAMSYGSKALFNVSLSIGNWE